MSKTISKEEIKAYFDSWRDVYRDKRMRGADLPVLLFIKDTNWDIFYVAQKKFAHSIGYSKKTINESLKNLVECGYLILTSSSPGSRKPNRYQLRKDLITPVKNEFQRYTDGLIVNTTKGYSSKNRVVFDDTQKGYPNVINEKDITLSVSENKSSKYTHEENDLSFLDELVPVETPPETPAPTNNRLASLYAYAQKCRPTSAPLTSKLAIAMEKALEVYGEEATKNAIAGWGRSKLSMTLSGVFKNAENFYMCVDQKSFGGIREE